MAERRETPAAVPRIAPDAVLTKQELAAALKVSTRKIERLDLPTIYLGPRTPRYLWKAVLAVLESRSA